MCIPSYHFQIVQGTVRHDRVWKSTFDWFAVVERSFISTFTSDHPYPAISYSPTTSRKTKTIRNV